MDNKWSDIEIVQFLDLFEACPCLWDADLDSYRSPDKRSEAIRWIIGRMGLRMSEMEIRCKIKNIRTTYVRYLKRMLRARHLGLGEDYAPTLVWFKRADVFLRTHTERTLFKKEQKRSLEAIRTSNRSSSSTTTKYASDSETEITAAEGEYDENIISQDSEATLVNSRNGGPSKKQKKSDAMGSSESDEDDQSKCEEDFPLMPRYSNNQPIPTLAQRNKLQQMEGIRRKYQVPNSNFDTGSEDHLTPHIQDEHPTLYRPDDPPTLHILANHRGRSKDHRGTYNHDVSSSRKRSKMSNNLQEEEDGFEIFSKLVANHLRQLPLEWSLRCQNDIHSLLVSERIKYSHEQARNKELSVISGRDELPSQEEVETVINQNQVFKEESFSFSMD